MTHTAQTLVSSFLIAPLNTTGEKSRTLACASGRSTDLDCVSLRSETVWLRSETDGEAEITDYMTEISNCVAEIRDCEAEITDYMTEISNCVAEITHWWLRLCG